MAPDRETKSIVSIIVPVLNDDEQLGVLLNSLNRTEHTEVIVCSGGGSSETHAGLRRRHPDVCWVSTVPGRGRQMNEGARIARGRWLLFLHADTRLDQRWMEEVARADRDPRVVAGSFRFSLDSGGRRARLIEWGTHLRVKWFNLPYGDQALFVRQAVFEAMGGYREWPMMEDVDLVRRLGRHGRFLHSALPARTSARRWERDGWLWRSAENMILVALFFAGVAPDRLARMYHRSQVGGQSALTGRRNV